MMAAAGSKRPAPGWRETRDASGHVCISIDESGDESEPDAPPTPVAAQQSQSIAVSSDSDDLFEVVVVRAAPPPPPTTTTTRATVAVPSMAAVVAPNAQDSSPPPRRRRRRPPPQPPVVLEILSDSDDTSPESSPTLPTATSTPDTRPDVLPIAPTVAYTSLQVPPSPRVKVESALMSTATKGMSAADHHEAVHLDAQGLDGHAEPRNDEMKREPTAPVVDAAARLPTDAHESGQVTMARASAVKQEATAATAAAASPSELMISPLATTQQPSPPVLTPRKTIVRRRRLKDEHAAFLLYYGNRDPPTPQILRQVIELVMRGTGTRPAMLSGITRYLLWSKFNAVADRADENQRRFHSEWMKIVLGSEDSRAHKRVSHRVEMLPRPVQLTVRPLQLLPLPSAKKSYGASSAASENSPRIDIRWIERRAIDIQRGDNHMRKSPSGSAPRRRVSVGTSAEAFKDGQFSPARPRASRQKRPRDEEGSISRALWSSPSSKRNKESVAARSPSITSTMTVPSLSIPGSDLEEDIPEQHTSGINRSVPKGWIADSMKPKAMNPFHSMSVDELKEHINSVRNDGRVKRFEKFSEILSKLMSDPRNRHGIFNVPVDPVALQLPTYNLVITHPMDLGTIKTRLAEGQYVEADDFVRDVKLVFENAMLFNPETHYVHIDAAILLRKFEEALRSDGDRNLKRRFQPERHSCSVCRGHTCALCDQGCLPFAQPHLTCAGICGTDLRKGSIYYVTRDGTRVWCAKCRVKLVRTSEDSNGVEENGTKVGPNASKRKHRRGGSLEKKSETTVEIVKVHGDLIKKKCDVDVEPWVKCSRCHRWLHQICGLYNPVFGAYSDDNGYCCPLCEYRQRSPLAASPKVHIANLLNPDTPSRQPRSSCGDIPSCELSEYIQDFLRRRLAEIGEGSAGDTLHIRVLSFPGERVVVPEGVVNTFKDNIGALEAAYPDKRGHHPMLPSEIDFTSRGIFLFQRHEGIEVCLFTLFVQEFGDRCQLPSNRRSVYVAYLDSIRYLKPARARTAAYHLIMMAYFDYIRRHGFQRVHIWSCPPQKRISYVFWCRPPFQKTPSAEHLRAWYRTLLTKAQTAGIVSSWTTMYDRYFVPSEAQIARFGPPPFHAFSASNGAAIGTRGATSRCVDPQEHVWPTAELPPIFDGDFLPAELDRILGRIAARNAKYRRGNHGGGKSSSVGSSGGKHAIGGFVTRIKEEAGAEPELVPVDIKLREVFDKCQHAVQRLRQDLLVVDLAVDPDDRLRPCEPERHVPAWWQQVPRFFGSRFMFHQLCATATYQFDSLRRAKHSTMMMLHHFFNERVRQLNTFCHECCLLITHAEYWYCPACDRLALCDMCHERHSPAHVHAMRFGHRPPPSPPLLIESVDEPDEEVERR